MQVFDTISMKISRETPVYFHFKTPGTQHTSRIQAKNTCRRKTQKMVRCTMVTWEKEKSYLQTDNRLHRTFEGAGSYGKQGSNDQYQKVGFLRAEAVLADHSLRSDRIRCHVRIRFEPQGRYLYSVRHDVRLQRQPESGQLWVYEHV